MIQRQMIHKSKNKKARYANVSSVVVKAIIFVYPHMFHK